MTAQSKTILYLEQYLFTILNGIFFFRNSSSVRCCIASDYCRERNCYNIAPLFQPSSRHPSISGVFRRLYKNWPENWDRTDYSHRKFLLMKESRMSSTRICWISSCFGGSIEGHCHHCDSFQTQNLGKCS
jgi:hypothetical protein